MAYDALLGKPLPDVAEPPGSPGAAAAAAAAVAAASALPLSPQHPGSGSAPPPLSAAEVEALMARFKVTVKGCLRRCGLHSQ